MEISLHEFFEKVVEEKSINKKAEINVGIPQGEKILRDNHI